MTKSRQSTYKRLTQQASERYSAGTGPWSKTEDLDQVDLITFENLASGYAFHSDGRGLLSGSIERLIEEVRRARGWTTPPEDQDIP